MAQKPRNQQNEDSTTLRRMYTFQTVQNPANKTRLKNSTFISRNEISSTELYNSK
jgi:hypothetical protein